MTRHLAVFATHQDARFDGGRAAAVDGLQSAELVPTADGARLVTAWSRAADFQAGRAELEGLVDPRPSLIWAGPAGSRFRRRPKWWVRYWPHAAWLLAFAAGVDAYVYRYLEFFGRPEVVLHDPPVDPIGVLHGESETISLAFMNVGQVPAWIELDGASSEPPVLLRANWQKYAVASLPKVPVGGVQAIRIPILPTTVGEASLRVQGTLRGGLIAGSIRFDETVPVRVWGRGVSFRLESSRVLADPIDGACRFVLTVGTAREKGAAVLAKLAKRLDVKMVAASGAIVEARPMRVKDNYQDTQPGNALTTLSWHTKPLLGMHEYGFEVHMSADRAPDDWRALCEQVEIEL